MKELKFECKSCGQKIGCDPSHAGRDIPCPSCGVEIRIPQPAAGRTQQLPKAPGRIPEKSGAVQPGKSPVSRAQGAKPADDRKRKPATPAGGRAKTADRHPKAACPCCGAQLLVEIAGGALPPNATVNLKDAGGSQSSGRRTKAEPVKKPTRTPGTPGVRTGRPNEGKRPNMAYILSGGAVVKPRE